MPPTLPPYTPPPAQQACVAAALAPLGVLGLFTALMCRLVDADTVLFCLALLTVWVVVELHRYQQAIDGYNADYVQRHLAWRSAASLQALAGAAAGRHEPTRAFVQRYLDAGCRLRRDGQAV